MLRLEKVDAAYGPIQVLRGIDLHVEKGEVVCLLGANGAGKTTLLKAITGGVNVTAGEVWFKGKNVSHWPIYKRIRQGVAHVPEGRRVFSNLSVADNLLLGGSQFLKGRELAEEMEKVYHFFPRLKERKDQLAGTLSGGEQEMLAIGRGLMMRPELILLDEPSQGLAPLIVEEIFRAIQAMSRSGLTILLVEQNIYQALQISHRGYVLKNGQVKMEGRADILLANQEIQETYLH